MSATVGTARDLADRSECDGPRRWWILPLVLIGVVSFLIVLSVVLDVTHLAPVAPSSGGPPPFWFLFPLGFLAFWLLVAFAWRPWGWRYGGGASWGAASRSAPEIVRARYARGEITRDQMRTMLQELGSTGAGSPDRPL